MTVKSKWRELSEKKKASTLSWFNTTLSLISNSGSVSNNLKHARVLTVSSPGVGFGQVVGTGINLVDGEEPWAGSTCINTISSVKMDINTPALHWDELSGFSL